MRQQPGDQANSPQFQRSDKRSFWHSRFGSLDQLGIFMTALYTAIHCYSASNVSLRKAPLPSFSTRNTMRWECSQYQQILVHLLFLRRFATKQTIHIVSQTLQLLRKVLNHTFLSSLLFAFYFYVPLCLDCSRTTAFVRTFYTSKSSFIFIASNFKS